MKKEFGDILTDSWKEYKDNFKVFLKIFLIFSVIPAILLFVLGIIFAYNFNSELVSLETSQQGIGFFLSSGVIPYLIIGGILLITLVILGIFMKTSFMYNVLYRKKNMNFNETLKGGKKYFWKFFWFSVVELIFLGGLFLLFGGLGALLMSFVSSILFSSQVFLHSIFMLMGAVIGSIPGIIFAVFWIFAGYVLISENKGIIESFKKSYGIVKDNWWKTFGYAILFGLVLFLISIVFSIASGIINFAIQLPFGFGLTEQIPFYISVLTSIVEQLFKLGASLISIPLGIMFFKNFYLDMKNRK